MNVLPPVADGRDLKRFGRAGAGSNGGQDRPFDGFDVFGGFGDIQHHRNDVAREAYDKVSDHHDEPIDRNKLWVIGDTPADVECGRAIGAKTIAVSTGMFSSDELQSSNPDHLFADFGETSRLLELLL